MSLLRKVKARARGAIDPQGQILLGFTEEDGQPVFGPRGNSKTYAPSGAGKTTSVALPAALSLIASEPEKTVLVSDPKDGEIAVQLVPMLADLGRNVGVIDPMNARPDLARWRIDINPFGAAVAAYQRDPRDLLYVNEMNALALIEEPEDRDMKNFNFRQSPREIIQLATEVLLKRDPGAATPGAAAALISDRDMLLHLAEVEAEEGGPALQSAARKLLFMRREEHFDLYCGEALRALRHWGPGTRMADCGLNAPHSHEDLIREGYVLFIVGPMALTQQMGPLYALNMGAFVQALYQKLGALRIIADEFTNSPLKPLISSAITTARSYGGEFHLISQSRSEVLRVYGEHLTQTIEDNCVTKRWLAFGSYREAEEVSKAIGEEFALSTAMSGETGGLSTNTNLSLVKQRQISASELMALRPDQQLIHIRGIGYFICSRVRQNEISPYCDLMAPNLMEGGKLPSDPKISLVTTRGARS